MAGFGAGFKRAVKQRYPARIELHPFGDVLPRSTNRITVDPNRSGPGSFPSRSMLDGWNRMHEVPNVFVVDGSAFPTASEKNPTLAIMALSWRATDILAELIRRGEI